jgi:uncharacterized protein (TIGR03067 family)
VDGLQEFQGCWRAVWRADDGRRATADEVAATSLTVAGDRFTLQLGGDAIRGRVRGSERDRGRGTVDFYREGVPSEACPGIYVLGDDELILCVAWAGRDRPGAFTPPRGSGQSAYLLTRPGAASPAPADA